MSSFRRRGTTIHFRPDPKIFGAKTVFDVDVIRARLEAKSYLHKGLKVVFKDEQSGAREEFQHPGGIVEYLGKLVASLVPGYITTIVGFGAYSLIVNLIVGGKVGGWFFPTPSWWLLILWVLPPFMAIALSLVLRLSARVKSTAAAQQAAGLVTFPLIIIAYGQSTGALLGSGAPVLAFGIGLVAWILAFVLLSTGFRSLTRGRLLGVADER